jgi:hypothetical protein
MLSTRQNRRTSRNNRRSHDGSYLVQFRSPFDDKRLSREFTSKRDARRFAREVNGRVFD